MEDPLVRSLRGEVFALALMALLVVVVYLTTSDVALAFMSVGLLFLVGIVVHVFRVYAMRIDRPITYSSNLTLRIDRTRALDLCQSVMADFGHEVDETQRPGDLVVVSPRRPWRRPYRLTVEVAGDEDGNTIVMATAQLINRTSTFDNRECMFSVRQFLAAVESVANPTPLPEMSESERWGPDEGSGSVSWSPLMNWLLVAIAGLAWLMVFGAMIAGVGDVGWFLVATGLAIWVSTLATRAPLLLRLEGNRLVVRRLFSTKYIRVEDVRSLKRTWGWFSASYISGPQYLFTLTSGRLFVPTGPLGDRNVIDVLAARNPAIVIDVPDWSYDDWTSDL